MASNSFGNFFRITTFGESRSEMLGVVIDGCPANIAISEKEIQHDLDRRAPGKRFTSQRKEKDLCHIVSGVYKGKTTGAPIAILIANEDSQTLEEENTVLKPSGANLSYFQKYGNFDPRGGGRASGRETALRVAAGGVAKKILKPLDVKILAYLSQVGEIVIKEKKMTFDEKKKRVEKSSFFCPDIAAEREMKKFFETLAQEKDSIGGVVSFCVENLPPNLGDPVYEKFHAHCAHALMSIPAARGITIGEGFFSACKKGSEHNDLIDYEKGRLHLCSNHAGGVLGGITTAEPFFGSVAFKPTPSIGKLQKSVTAKGEKKEFRSLTERNDLCIGIRAVPVVEAMLALVIVDSILMRNALRALS